MRPPTRSTRSVRPPPPNTIHARRNSGRSTTGPHPAASHSEASTTPPQPQPESKSKSRSKSRSKLQSIITTAPATADAKVVDPGTLPGSDPAPASAAPVISCFPAFPPATFVFENQSQNIQVQSQSHPESESSLSLLGPSVAGTIVLGLGKPPPPRSRQRLSSDKLEALDASFRRNTHPSRKEKEVICRDLDMDLKTVTIWFQNKRQTVARSRRQLESEGATASTAAMDMLASASATMSPLAATEEPSVSLASATVHPGAEVQTSLLPDCPSLSQSAPRSLHASSCDSITKSHQPRVPLSAVAHNPNVFFFESVRTGMSSTCVSPDLHKPGDWSIHPEDLWKHIPSSPAQPVLSSPDVSPDIDTPSRSSRLLVQRPRTLEWACARSAKRRRTDPGALYHEDGETDSECNPIEGPCTSFSISEARVPLECYDRYPLDVVRGAVLLLRLRDAACDLEL